MMAQEVKNTRKGFFSWTFWKNVILAILKGQLLLKLRIGEYFIHIVYCFILFFLVILINMMVEKTLVKVESNKAVLEDLEIRHTQRTIELTGFNKMGTIEKILREQGSNLRMPEKPATLIED